MSVESFVNTRPINYTAAPLNILGLGWSTGELTSGMGHHLAQIISSTVYRKPMDEQDKVDLPLIPNTRMPVLVVVQTGNASTIRYYLIDAQISTNYVPVTIGSEDWSQLVVTMTTDFVTAKIDLSDSTYVRCIVPLPIISTSVPVLAKGSIRLRLRKN